MMGRNVGRCDVRERRTSGSTLASECEAFLAGRLVEQFVEGDVDVPVWAWLNLLAHGEKGQLVRPPMRLVGRGSRDLSPWCEARGLLAHEVVQRGRRVGSLLTVQRRVMVPLELQLAADRSVARWQPSQLVRVTLSVLEASSRQG